MTSITESSEEEFEKKTAGKKTQREVDQVTIRFAGDSGDGMQLTGSRFTTTAAIFGNDLATFPDYPAEIRAPAGTVAGVSGFQVNFSTNNIHTPGDHPELLVAMNPAALQANYKDVPKGGVILVNEDTFTESNLKKAGYQSNPLEDKSLQNYKLITVPITKMTRKALNDVDISDKDKDRSKNMFALGLTFWMFERDLDATNKWIEQKFKGKDLIIEANKLALKAGYYFAETSELLPINFRVKKAKLAPGTYRNLTGNEALSLGLLTVAQLADEQVFLGAYPITPASDILHYLAKFTHYGVHVFQAEDEIAAICSAIGASYAGSIGLTATSGPGLALKGEALGLAVIAELPLVVINVQRGGPSTGLPTKVEQSDLMQAMYGRNGESPLCVIAAHSPVDCYYKAIEAVKLSLKYMTPVVLLSDAFLANGSEAWKLPEISSFEKIEIKHRTNVENFEPYSRDEETLARPWVKPGTPGLEHRIGGLEKQDITGTVSYDPANHQHMTKLREEKVARMANDIPLAEVLGEGESDVLVIGWGSTHGSIFDARKRMEHDGVNIHQLHIDYINPFPLNLAEILAKYKTRIVAEINNGQLVKIMDATFPGDFQKINKIQGRPFTISELVDKISEMIK